MLRCRLLGHRFRFTSEGETMRWQCERGCGAGGAKRYATAAEASRYARASTARTVPTSAGGLRSLGLFPLRLLRAFRERRDRHRDSTE